ncbi:hypothetical protein AKG98_2059 [Moritella sp. JT01]|uniref:hypothetical protein n=1 Tax=Moritella sp. JT01 TaxID=756698 RepID=UPI00079B12FD|nr:hypothetical protein [Moritella sp. JT01]KXO08015.1 hypothetical protein AKG98_2059 [Moritella sp. JT01]
MAGHRWRTKIGNTKILWGGMLGGVIGRPKGKGGYVVLNARKNFARQNIERKLLT